MPSASAVGGVRQMGRRAKGLVRWDQRAETKQDSYKQQGTPLEISHQTFMGYP